MRGTNWREHDEGPTDPFANQISAAIAGSAALVVRPDTVSWSTAVRACNLVEAMNGIGLTAPAAAPFNRRDFRIAD